MFIIQFLKLLEICKNFDREQNNLIGSILSHVMQKLCSLLDILIGIVFFSVLVCIQLYVGRS